MPGIARSHRFLPGSESHYDFGARIYDGRIGRWLAVDPLAGKYTDLSPFCFVANIPINFIDPDGKKIKGVRYNAKTGEFKYSKSAIKNGTKDYIEARMATEQDAIEIIKLIEHKNKVKIIATDKVLLSAYYDPGEMKTKYAIVRGITTSDGKVIVVSTNNKSYKEITPDDEFVILSAETIVKNIYDVDLEGDLEFNDIENPFDNTNLPEAIKKVYRDVYRAYEDSGKKEYDNSNEYSGAKEILHSVGAHEETHLLDIWEDNTELLKNDYEREKKAMINEVESRKNFKEEVVDEK